MRTRIIILPVSMTYSVSTKFELNRMYLLHASIFLIIGNKFIRHKVFYFFIPVKEIISPACTKILTDRAIVTYSMHVN